MQTRINGGTITPTQELVSYRQPDGTTKQEPRWIAISDHITPIERVDFATFSGARHYLWLINERVESEECRRGLTH